MKILLLLGMILSSSLYAMDDVTFCKSLDMSTVSYHKCIYVRHVGVAQKDIKDCHEKTWLPETFENCVFSFSDRIYTSRNGKVDESSTPRHDKKRPGGVAE